DIDGFVGPAGDHVLFGDQLDGVRKRLEHAAGAEPVGPGAVLDAAGHFPLHQHENQRADGEEDDDDERLQHAHDDVGQRLAHAGAEQPFVHLPVHLAHHDVDAADDGHHVRHQAAHAQGPQQLQVREARGAVVHPPRVFLAAADDVHAHLAARRLHAGVRVALQAHAAGDLADEIAGRNLVQGLADDADGFVELLHPHEIARVHVAVLADGDAEVQTMVDAVRMRLAHVVGHARAADDRPAGAVFDGVFRAQHADALDTRLENAVAGEQGVILVQSVYQVAQDAAHDDEEPVIQVVPGTADAQVVVQHAGAGQLLENVQQLLAFPERIQKDRGGAQVQRERAEPDQVAGDALQLAHDDTNILRSFGNFYIHQAF